MPMSMIKDVWQSLSGQIKPGKDVFLGTLSHISATGGHWVGAVEWTCEKD
jgi:hypothetical protein